MCMFFVCFAYTIILFRCIVGRGGSDSGCCMCAAMLTLFSFLFPFVSVCVCVFRCDVYSTIFSLFEKWLKLILCAYSRIGERIQTATTAPPLPLPAQPSTTASSRSSVALYEFTFMHNFCTVYSRVVVHIYCIYVAERSVLVSKFVLITATCVCVCECLYVFAFTA